MLDVDDDLVVCDSAADDLVVCDSAAGGAAASLAVRELGEEAAEVMLDAMVSLAREEGAS